MKDEGVSLNRLAVECLLREAGTDSANWELTSLPGGRNNRVYRVTAGPHRFFLKQYYRHPSDPRDRFAAETAFLRYCHAEGIDVVPRLRAADPAEGLALMDFVEGAPISRSTLRGEDIGHAIQFLLDLNKSKRAPAAQLLPEAADHCDTVAAHVALVDRRIERLKAIKPESEPCRTAVDLVEGRLRPLWSRLRRQIAHRAQSAWEQPWPRSAKLISPSDFGFHNALRTEKGGLIFVDFEYAGWDDPAKTAADFFYQPAIPPPDHFRDAFDAAVVEASGSGASVRQRVELLRPLFGIKWCCILLNEFLPTEAARRVYAEPSVDWDRRRRKQLEALSRLLDRLENEFGE